MKQNQNNIDCAPTKQEEGVAKCLIQMCKDSNAAITSFRMDCEDGYEVTISARKKGKRIYNEFSLEEFEAIKAMAEEKLAQTEDKQKLQDIIDVCESNIEDIKEKEQENLKEEEEE
ncbi:hypothetical protein [Segatella copri]|uniref:Uncharacterized protein n=1 Tax=Segatella copri TaxID=165179 RepID=A0AA92W378_9BACT|nr:hypothetical protein [Segatella copri]RGU90728.1 hypothetical protein DWW35_14195 [Segatella copri]